MWTKQVNCVPSTALANSDHIITNVMLTLTHGSSVCHQIFRNKLVPFFSSCILLSVKILSKSLRLYAPP